ncbi:uncharacterized protein LOC106086156 isoform X2 [Stomoxys calcitrans]|uniref:Uncharacterized protein n=1 Tax=Stomoxys calcitrans TaxID=35570 RepID=A0A1I8Q3N5_STOCA|nr:uncharacterized protein LOC106086156 isoform X2 [Stomoxys calcitrans]
MRTKHFVLVLCCIAASTLLFIIFGTSESNDSFKNIVSHTHQQINKFQENLRVSEEKKLEIDEKYLSILGFTSYLPNNTKKNVDETVYFKYDAHNTNEKTQTYMGHSMKMNNMQYLHYHIQNVDNAQSTQSQVHATSAHVFNGTKVNFTIVTYVQEGQAPSAILLSQNIALKFPNEYLIIYDLGLSEEDLKALSAYCNNSRCLVISYDLSIFPSHVTDQRMHAYRSIVIKDALMRSKSILFAENYIRIRGTNRDLNELRKKLHAVGVLGWNTPTAVSTRTHPKMFDYFQTDADDYFFLKMVDLDTVLFEDTDFVAEKILLPWIKCALTLECLDPIELTRE